jgi:XTP/dITP diphosphohydrolase
MKLYLATANIHKLNEIKAVLPDTELFPGYDRLSIEENGHTFEENAIIKALALSRAVFCKRLRGVTPSESKRRYLRFTDEYVLADDSGLTVDALNGAPGVLSHRYAHNNATDQENNDCLLWQLKDESIRTAKFVCVLALAAKGEVLGTFRGECLGSISYAPRGRNGFGYDPIFLLPDGRTMAELSSEEKNQISHRSTALRKMRLFWNERTHDEIGNT